jgi:predicted amidohydrolase
LKIGTEADVTIIKLVDASDTLLGDHAKDSDGNSRTLEKRIVPIAVFRAGKFYTITN